uniref:Uncharacterized protein n=1 Tax=viral metagenome TaxID=1070528 RepID=A0A6C0HVT2_9ZZZZ
MYLSRVLMILALAVLAYLVWITMSDCDTFKNDKKKKMPQEQFTQVQEAPVAIIAPVPSQIEHFEVPTEPSQQAPQINYEQTPANIDGIADNVYGAAPFAGKSEMDEGKFATVKYSGLVDAKPGDVIQIEGTDLLTAPLVDNMLYTNSIANTNRNASNDLRGDIPLQFNDTYTPFYSSVIYGAPLSQKQMTISKI